MYMSSYGLILRWHQILHCNINVWYHINACFACEFSFMGPSFIAFLVFGVWFWGFGSWRFDVNDLTLAAEVWGIRAFGGFLKIRWERDHSIERNDSEEIKFGFLGIYWSQSAKGNHMGEPTYLKVSVLNFKLDKWNENPPTWKYLD